MLAAIVLSLSLAAASGPGAHAQSVEANSNHEGNDLDCEWISLALPNTPCTLAGGWRLVRDGQVTGDPGRYHFALGIARQFQQVPEQHTEATLLTGYALQQLHRFDEAYERVHKLLSTAPVAGVYQLLGDISLDQGRLEQAAGFYQQQINLKPSPGAYIRAANVRYLAGNVDGALELLSLGLEGAARSPDTGQLAWALRLGGRFLLADHQISPAVEMLEHSVALAPNPDSRLLLARALLAQDQPRAARDRLLELTGTYPQPEALALLAELGEPAPPHSQSGLQQNRQRGDRLDARGHARYLLVTNGDLDQAMTLLDGELAQRRDPITLALAAWAAARTNQPDKATDLINEALAIPYPEPFPYVIAALAAERNQQPGVMKQHLLRASQQPFLLTPVERALYARLVGLAF